MAKGQTNAIRGEVSMMPSIVVDNSTATLEVNITNSSSASNATASGPSSGVKFGIMPVGGSLYCVAVVQYTWVSLSGSSYSNQYKHENTKFTQNTVNLGAIIKTNLPAGTSLTISIRNMVSVTAVMGSVIATVNGTVNADGSVTISLPSGNVTVWDSSSARNVRNLNVAFGIDSIDSLGGGGELELIQPCMTASMMEAVA